MTTRQEFEKARNASAADEPDVRTEFAHCRGFGVGARWMAHRIADKLEDALAAGLEHDKATVAIIRYARGHDRIIPDPREGR